jgi:hypothetical protein
MKPKRRARASELLATLVVLDDDGANTTYAVPADLVPEAHIPGIEPIADEAAAAPKRKSALRQCRAGY